MTDRAPHLTLRRMRQHLLNPLTLTALAAVSVVLALVGPFGTIATLGILPRLAYWSTLTVAGYAIGYCFNAAILDDETVGRPHLARLGLAGLATGAAMVVMVSAMNWVTFDLNPIRPESLTLIGTTLLIAVIVTAVIDLFMRRLAPAKDADAPALPPILDRLPLDKRGALVALSVEDHYVRVRTTRGEDLLLMRLADAIREVGTVRGAQVHRSHWAAFDHVISVAREGDRAVLSMRHGDDIPVSRRHIPTLKEAGLLPR